MISKIALFIVLLVEVNCFYLKQEFNRPIAFENLPDSSSEQRFEYLQPIHERERRQVRGAITTNPDGKTNIMAKLPITGNDKNIVSAVGGLHDVKPGSIGAESAGLAWDNIKGHGLTLTGMHIPDKADHLTAAANLNLINTDKHDLNLNALATRTFPKDQITPNFNTYGGGVDYMFNKKIGASIDVAHTPLFEKTDYSALGKVNLFRDRSSSLDFNAGASRSFSPFMPKTSWEPTVGFKFSKFF